MGLLFSRISNDITRYHQLRTDEANPMGVITEKSPAQEVEPSLPGSSDSMDPESRLPTATVGQNQVRRSLTTRHIQVLAHIRRRF